jgi:hypothetical protein
MVHTGHMTTTDFNLTGMRVQVNYTDPTDRCENFIQTGTVLAQTGSVLRIETDEDEHGDTEIILALDRNVEIIVPTILVADETDRPADMPLIDPDAIDGTYRLEEF